jgi:hypothetical protein
MGRFIMAAESLPKEVDEEVAPRCTENDPDSKSRARRQVPAGGFCTLSGCLRGWTMTPANEATRRNSRSRAPIKQLTIYDGQQRVGSIVERDGKFLTYDIDDLHLGVFATLRDAMRSLPPARSSS